MGRLESERCERRVGCRRWRRVVSLDLRRRLRWADQGALSCCSERRSRTLRGTELRCPIAVWWEQRIPGETRTVAPAGTCHQKAGGQIEEDYRRIRLSRLRPGEQLAYVFDLGDYWATCVRSATTRSTQSRPWRSGRI